MDKRYLFIVIATSIVLPVTALLIANAIDASGISFQSFCKWFVFFAAGVRLFIAGLKQVFQPKFTAQEIFRISTTEVFPIIRELGFANICFGLVGLLSVFLPEWRIVSAFASGIYFGLAGILHLIKKPANTNEKIAMVSDLYIFTVLAVYVGISI
jgi:hypothetical protein